MKRNMRYMASLLSLALLFPGCEKIEPELFDEGANGAYFDYEYATDFERTLNFADHIVDSPDTVSVSLRIKILGYIKDETRTLAVKTKPVEGYGLADVTIDDVAFSGNEYEKEIEVKVRRPEMEDSIFAVCIYLDGSGDIGTGISEKDAINLYVTESYEKPTIWSSHVETHLGKWNKEKHIFLAEHTRNNQYYDNLYNNQSGAHDYDSSFALNVSAVNALLAVEPKEPIMADLPILKWGNDEPAYTEPYFWSLYEEQLGMYTAKKFCNFITMLGGTNTRDIAALYASEKGQQKMQEEALDFHKEDVLYMLNEYYAYAQQGIALAEYKERCWVKMQKKVYTLRIPYWWEDPQGLGTGEIVKKYFGDYTEDKYQFMLMRIMEVDSPENFMAASLFPFVKEGDRYVWDDTPFGQEDRQLSGEERFMECYRIIKEKNDALPPSLKFDIPEVEL